MDVVELFLNAANTVVTAIVDEFEEAIGSDSDTNNGENETESPRLPKSHSKSTAKQVESDACAPSKGDDADDEDQAETLALKAGDGWEGFSSDDSDGGESTSGTSFMEASMHSSVSHETFNFTKALVSNLDHARNLFLNRHARIKLSSARSFSNTSMPAWQIAHAKSILNAVPTLDQLRFELCPSMMADRMFWHVYFQLVRDHQSFPSAKHDEEATPTTPSSRKRAREREPSPTTVTVDTCCSNDDFGNEKNEGKSAADAGQEGESSDVEKVSRGAEEAHFIDNYFLSPPSPELAREQETKRARCDMSPKAKSPAVAEADQGWMVVKAAPDPNLEAEAAEFELV